MGGCGWIWTVLVRSLVRRQAYYQFTICYQGYILLPRARAWRGRWEYIISFFVTPQLGTLTILGSLSFFYLSGELVRRWKLGARKVRQYNTWVVYCQWIILGVRQTWLVVSTRNSSRCISLCLVWRSRRVAGRLVQIPEYDTICFSWVGSCWGKSIPTWWSIHTIFYLSHSFSSP